MKNGKKIFFVDFIIPFASFVTSHSLASFVTLASQLF